MAFRRFITGIKHFAVGPIHHQGGILFGIGGTGQHAHQGPAMWRLGGCSSMATVAGA
jgi:hypothetical protein